MNPCPESLLLNWIRFLFLAALISCINITVNAEKSLKKIDEDLLLLNETTKTFRNQVLALLTIIKELDKKGPNDGSNGANLVDQKEPAGAMSNKTLYTQLSVLNGDIEDRYNALKIRVSEIEKKSAELASGDQPGNSRIQQEISEVSKKIDKYYTYANKFIEPYLQFLVPGETPDKKRKPIPSDRFMGKVSLGLGRTVQSSAGDVSGFAGNIGFNGLYRVNNNTSVTGGVSYREEVMRTPYASIRANAGINNTFNNKIRLNASVGYNNYNDKQSNNNDFDFYNASVNLFAPLGKKSHVSGHLSRGLRTYKLDNGNSFASTRYQVNVSLSNDHTQETNIFLRGNLQSSQLDYLKFNQLNPGLIFTRRRDPSRLFTTLIDLNQFTYSGEAESNNFSRGRLDVKWTRKRKDKSSNSIFGIIGKIYPNNERLNYLRGNMVFSSTSSNLALGRSKSSTFRTTYTYYLQQSATLLDYLDMRFDRLIRGRGAFFNFNMFGRIYNAYNSETDVYQTLDMFLSAGPIIRNRVRNPSVNYNFRLGPIVGTHMLVGSEYEFWENSGTSLRVGITLQGYLNIKKASLRLMGSYEKQILVTNEYDIDYNTGDLIVGETYYREPNSFQLSADFKLPVGKAWDIFFNVDYYNIRTDAREETSINPNEQNMRQRMVGGVIYRFVL